jgi:hypothetical protein
MTQLSAFISLMAALLIANEAAAASRIMSSEGQRAVLIELYTSEGCSSCPPADRWLSRLKGDPRLWKFIVPVAFHVDYWNYLGWRDRFAQARFSKRQNNYQRHDYLQTVYTPGVMKNGREWRGWHNSKILIPADRDNAGILKAVFDHDNTIVEFMPERRYRTPLVLNITLLGFDLTTRVRAGENTGKTLSHDFVVMDFRQISSEAPQDGRFRWKLPQRFNALVQDAAGIALWVTAGDDPTPLQATGGWLK